MVRNFGVVLLSWIVRGLISIRYRLRIRGLNAPALLKLAKEGGVLFLPNHPAEVDPIIIVTLLWPHFKAHPVVVENFYYMKGIAHWVQKRIGALPIPDLSGKVNKWKQKKIEKLFNQVADGLKTGHNYVIYPAGKLKGAGQESIGGASFSHNLVQACPNTRIVLMRTTGLWGSRFSKALTGSTPDFGKAAWEGIKLVLKNLIFLTPRREVTIEVELAPTDFPAHGSRLEFNQYLERWYNMRGPEPLKLVSDKFWKQSFPFIAAPKEEVNHNHHWTIAPEAEKEILDKIGKIGRRTGIDRSQNLAQDLGFDSLDIAQLYAFLDERFELGRIDPADFQTVEDVLRSAAGAAERKKEKHQEPKIRWPVEESRPPTQSPHWKTLQEVFLKTCDRMDSYTACADELMGIISYRRFKMMALILSDKIRKLEGDNIGILLPSTTMTYVLIFATLLAKKVPVMFNWTMGVRSLDHCVKTAQVKTIISSNRFLNNLTNGDLGSAWDILLLLEDLRDEISLKDKMWGLWWALLKNGEEISQKLHLKSVSEDETAVILFTSGTESFPKGVPLTHKNLLSNQRAGLECIKLDPRDVFYGILPPFHSFGFSVAGILPILIGLKVYYAPDPTDSPAMVYDIADWGVTVFVCAPTFIRGVFHAAKPDQLKTLRYVVSGAEKTPDDIFAYMEKHPGIIMEGYGITECGPMVSVTRAEKPRHGVGEPLSNVELIIIDPETHRILPAGVDGEICIYGPGVFQGYLGSIASPFIELEGKRWYHSGDRGRLENGCLVLTGRLKRFVKIGGEMVSLGGLEEEILQMARARNWIGAKKDDLPPLAIALAEKESEKPLIVLFTVFDINKDIINDALREKGYGRIVKIAEVRKMDQIPTTGTGKIHYRALDEML